jgi:Neuraminidase (sialidase)
MSTLRLIAAILIAALQLCFGCDGGADLDVGSSGPAPEQDYESQVATDGAGNWVAVWQSGGSLGGTIGEDIDILVARSTDDGATWTTPTALNTNAGSDTGDDLQPQVTTDGAGNWVAVWRSGDSLGDTIGEDIDILVARSTDDGATWTPPAALNSTAVTDSEDDWCPQVTTDGAGNWVAVWNSDQGFNAPSAKDQDIMVARSTDAGATWTPRAALNTDAGSRNEEGGDGLAQVTTDGAGNWVAVWRSLDALGETIGADADILVSRSTNGGATWSSHAALNSNAATDIGYDGWPQVATDGTNWVAVWQSQESFGDTIGEDYDILVARSTDAGATWTAPEVLNSNAATDDASDTMPQVTTDGAGNWVAVWESDDPLSDTILDRDILVSRSTDAGATWTAPAPLNTNAATDSGLDRWPQLTTDGLGAWVAVWTSDDSLAGTIGGDADILEARSTDDGATWTAPVALNTTAGSDAGD